MPQPSATKCFSVEGCQLSIAEPRAQRLLIVLEGMDVGKLGREPFHELNKRLDAERPLELFFDLRAARGATLEASGSWAVWLRTNRKHLGRVSMLTARRNLTSLNAFLLFASGVSRLSVKATMLEGRNQ